MATSWDSSMTSGARHDATEIRVSGDLWPLAVIGTLLAVTINLGVYLAGRVVDVPFVVASSPAAEPMTVTALHVAAATTVALVFGIVAVAVAARWQPRVAPALQGLGVVLALGTMALPLMQEATTATKLLLAAMHLIAGAAFVGAVQVYLRT